MTLLFAFSLLFWDGNGGFVVVVEKSVPIESLSPQQLQQIFLGTVERVNGIDVAPVLLREGDPLQIAFEKSIFGQAFDLEEYWVAQKIKLGTPPPRKARNWALVVAYVQRNPGFIGVLPQAMVEELEGFNLKVIEIRKN